ncbi:MAG: hypothetical protein EHM55_18515 [Acidobacteria bacterium]|nr:MAG: hypothetical protein EHM55_18515 [Acidobacteriota bacterium]
MKQAVPATVMAAALGVGVVAQGAATKALPLDNVGLEHLDSIVPDPAASARFNSRIFKAALHQQPARDTLLTSCCSAIRRALSYSTRGRQTLAETAARRSTCAHRE